MKRETNFRVCETVEEINKVLNLVNKFDWMRNFTIVNIEPFVREDGKEFTIIRYSYELESE